MLGPNGLSLGLWRILGLQLHPFLFFFWLLAMRRLVFLDHILLLWSVPPSEPQAQAMHKVTRDWPSKPDNHIKLFYSQRIVSDIFLCHRNLTNTEVLLLPLSIILGSPFIHTGCLHSLASPPSLSEPTLPWLTAKMALFWSRLEFANVSHHSRLGIEEERPGLYGDSCAPTTGNWFSWSHLVSIRSKATTVCHKQRG